MLVIVSLIAATFSGVTTLPVGVLGHEGGAMLVVLNSLRLLFDRDRLVQHAAPDGLRRPCPHPRPLSEAEDQGEGVHAGAFV